MNKFLKDLNFGKSGEDIIFNLLKNDSRTKDVIDVRKEKLFQQMDIDFIQFFKNGKSVLIEVKTDSKAQETGNIAYEHTSNINFNTVGCFEKTSAHLIYYCIPSANEILILNVQKLREYVRSHKDNYENVNMGDSAMGYLVPIVEILKNNLGGKVS